MPARIGLVLGGGGSRGLAHIGVLQVLERENIPIDLLVGTSMGAIIAAFYALGVTPERMFDYANTALKNSSMLSFNLFSAEARQRTVQEHLEKLLKEKTFADLSIPLTVMAVDVLSGQEVAIREGLLLPAVLASSAVPAVFPPVEHMGMQLADGGVIDSLATRPAFEQGAERVIAVDVYPALEQDNPWVDPISAVMGFQLPFKLFGSTPGVLSSLWRSFRVMAWYTHQSRIAAHPPHVLIRPDVDEYGSLDFNDVQGPVSAGAAAAEALLPQLRGLLATE